MFLRHVPPRPGDRIAGLKWLVAYCGMNDKIYRDKAGVGVELSKRTFSTPYPYASPAPKSSRARGRKAMFLTTKRAPRRLKARIGGPWIAVHCPPHVLRIGFPQLFRQAQKQIRWGAAQTIQSTFDRAGERATTNNRPPPRGNKTA